MYLLIVFLPLLGSSVAGFFGRFLGSEGIAIMTIGRYLVLFGLLLLGLIFMFRLYSCRLKKKYGSRVVYVLYISLLCFTSLFGYGIRIYVVSNIGLFLSDVVTVFMGTCAVSGSGGEVNPHSENFQASHSEPTSVGQVPNRDEAGPSNPGPREYNSPWKSFPSVPSDLPPLPAGSVPSVPSLPSVGSDFEVEQPAPIQSQDAPNEPRAPARHDPAPWEDPFWNLQHETIKHRIATLTPEREVYDDEIDSMIMLKGSIIDRMAQLDPHPFWAEQKHNLISDGILNKEAEYTMDTLHRNYLLLIENGEGRGSDSSFFKRLLRIRENFELEGRFD